MEVVFLVNVHFSLVWNPSGELGGDGPVISCLVTDLVSAVLQDLTGTSSTSDLAGNIPSQYLQIVLREDETALQLPPLVGVWSVGVQQGGNVGEFPELHSGMLRNMYFD